MTIAQQLEQKGIEKGIEKGIQLGEQKGKLEVGVSLDIENYCTIRASRHVNVGIQGFCLLFSKNKGERLRYYKRP